jgi:hypothetical protein
MVANDVDSRRIEAVTVTNFVRVCRAFSLVKELLLQSREPKKSGLEEADEKLDVRLGILEEACEHRPEELTPIVFRARGAPRALQRLRRGALDYPPGLKSSRSSSA